MAKNNNDEKVGRMIGLLEALNLPELKKDVSDIKTNMATLCQQEKSTQAEITEHKEDHKYNTGLTITIATFISGLFAWVITYFRGGK